MLKAALITLIGAGTLGTGASAFTPQNLAVTAGSVSLELGTNGAHMNVAETPEFSVTLSTKGQREFTIRF